MIGTPAGGDGVAEGVRETELGAYQRAARTILAHPLVSATNPDRDALTLIRRFAVPLGHDLDELAGYRLELAPTCARLVRRIDRLDPTQEVRAPNRTHAFDRRRYAYLCLVLGALGRAGSQVALTELADALKRRAAEIDGLGFDPDDYRHRLAFIDVVTVLTEWGALVPVEVSTVAWLRDPDAGEALYDVDRDVVHLTFVAPRVLQHVHSVRALLASSAAASRDTKRAEVRQRLVRLLLEHPVVYFDDLDDAERGYLVSQGRAVADDLHRLTGGQVERRAEGVALIDASGGFSDRRFPAGGTAAQAALLLADAIAARISTPAEGDGVGSGTSPTATVPGAADEVATMAARIDAARPLHSATEDVVADAPDRPDDVEPVAAPFVPDAWLLEVVTELCHAHGRAFAADLRDDPVALTTAAVDVLAAFDLARRVPGGVIVRPLLARYRDVQVSTAPAPQLSLLDPAPEAS